MIDVQQKFKQQLVQIEKDYFHHGTQFLSGEKMAWFTFCQEIKSHSHHKETENHNPLWWEINQPRNVTETRNWGTTYWMHQSVHYKNEYHLDGIHNKIKYYWIKSQYVWLIYKINSTLVPLYFFT